MQEWRLAFVVPLLVLAGCSGTGSEATDPNCDDCGPGGGPAPNETTGCIDIVAVDSAIRPLAGVTVSIASLQRSGTTNAEGRALLCSLEPGSYLVTANRTGHHPAQVLVQVQAGKTLPVKLTLALIPKASQPYHLTQPFRGYTDLSAGVLTPLADPTIGQTGTTTCACRWDVTPDSAPAAIVIEATWDDWAEDPTGPTEFIYQVTAEGAPGEASGQMADPLVKTLGRIDFGDPGFSFANATSYHISIYPDATWPAVGQEFHVYVTMWYMERPPEGWSFLEGDP